MYGGWFGDGDLLLGAAVKDALIILAGVAAASAVARLWRPAFAPLLVALLLGIAYAIEFTAVRDVRWSYAGDMPIIVGGVGLSPFLQLAVTGVVAVGITSRRPHRIG